MRKVYIFIVLSMVICILFSSCKENKDHSDYKNTEGYVEYTSYIDNGSEYANYYGIPEAIEKNDKARQYYENNVRKCGDFLITDYLDGICINDYVGDINDNSSECIIVPETLDGKPVIAIGSCKVDDSSVLNPDEWFDSWGGEYWSALYGADIMLPATVKYIGEYTALGANSFTVDDNNPYYSSKDGCLYTKDMKVLLFYDRNIKSNAKIPEKTETFAPLNGVVGTWGNTLELGKNIKTIDAEYFYTESEEYSKYPFVIKGYKDTAAERWAKANLIEFAVLD